MWIDKYVVDMTEEYLVQIPEALSILRIEGLYSRSTKKLNKKNKTIHQ